MWYVNRDNCWWAFRDREDADELAERIGGVVHSEEELRAEGRSHGERHDQLQADTEAGDVSCQQGE